MHHPHPALPPLPPQALLTADAPQNTLNDRKQLPYDLCITDAARELLEQYGYAYVRDSATSARPADEPKWVLPSLKCPGCARRPVLRLRFLIPRWDLELRKDERDRGEGGGACRHERALASWPAGEPKWML